MNNFFTTAELKPSDFIPVSYNFDLEDMHISASKASNDVIAIIGQETFDVIEGYLDKYTSAEKVEKTAVENLAATLYNMALYHQFIFMVVNIKNNSITVENGKDSRALNKGEAIQLRDQFLEFSYSALNDLVVHLNANVDAIKKDDTAVWKESEQYKETQDLIFSGFREFSKYAGLTIHAAFYFNARHIMREVIDESVLSRIKLDDETLKDTVLLPKVKRALARQVVALSCVQLPIDLMPSTVRQSIDKESYTTRTSEQEVRKGIGNTYASMADKEWRALDMYIASKMVTKTDTSPVFEESANWNEKNKTAGIM